MEPCSNKRIGLSFKVVDENAVEWPKFTSFVQKRAFEDHRTEKEYLCIRYGVDRQSISKFTVYCRKSSTTDVGIDFSAISGLTRPSKYTRTIPYQSFLIYRSIGSLEDYRRRALRRRFR